MSRILVRSLLVLVLSQFSYSAFAHDIWISRGAGKNPAGEWCCGAEDCGVVSPNAVKAGNGGYSVAGAVTYGVGVTGNEADGPTRQETSTTPSHTASRCRHLTARIGAASGRMVRHDASSHQSREGDRS